MKGSGASSAVGLGSGVPPRAPACLFADPHLRFSHQSRMARQKLNPKPAMLTHMGTTVLSTLTCQPSSSRSRCKNPTNASTTIVMVVNGFMCCFQSSALFTYQMALARTRSTIPSRRSRSVPSLPQNIAQLRARHDIQAPLRTWNISCAERGAWGQVSLPRCPEMRASAPADAIIGNLDEVHIRVANVHGLDRSDRPGLAYGTFDNLNRAGSEVCDYLRQRCHRNKADVR